MKKLTIIIPTMYYHIPKMLEMLPVYSESKWVEKILLVNNNQAEAVMFNTPKVRTIGEGVNLFVNKSWKLGALLSPTEIIALVNDDILLNGDIDSLFRVICETDMEGKIIGPAVSCYRSNEIGHVMIEKAPTGEMTHGFGAFMFCRKTDLLKVNILPEIKVWYGDKILHKKYDSYVFKGIWIEDYFGGTTKTMDLKGVAALEKKLYQKYYEN